MAKKPTKTAATPATEPEAEGNVAATAPVAQEPTADETGSPPAPGDDVDSVFSRRLDRLNRIVDEAEFESGTAFGDARDTILDVLKHRPAWSTASEGQRRDLVVHIEGLVKRVIGKIVLVIAQEESDTVAGTFLGAFSVKGEAIEAKIKIEHVDADVLVDIYKMAGHKVVLVSADDKRFLGAARAVEVPSDQLAMGFASDKAPNEIRTAPPGDSDLAGEEPLFRVVDRDVEGTGDADQDPVYLEPDEINWIESVEAAGAWPEAKARELGAELLAEVEPVDPPAETSSDRTHGEDSAIDDEAEELDPDRLRDDAQERERLERENPTPAED